MLRATLERLGPTFVKFGQALSLRRDLLPEPYLVALRDLQDHATPFPAGEAKREIERGLGRATADVFAEFEAAPMAAASIAQVHRARPHDGRAVVVKVRRPAIRAQIDRDMRALVSLVRLAVVLAPRVARFRPADLIHEIWTNMRRETDFRQEARNIRRFAEAFKGWDTAAIPREIEGLYGEAVLVQEMSGGRSIDDPALATEGPRLAQAFVDIYLHQFFRIGVFHGDPHPGNLFITFDGRICFHDFGLVGFLDRGTRRSLGMFLEAFVRLDSGWMLDAAIELGIIGGDIDRPAFTRGIEEILADYASLPLKDWSIAEAMLRIARLGSGQDFVIPHNLVVLMRAMLLVENAVRTLDPEFRILDSLLKRGQEAVEMLLKDASADAGLARLRHEAALTVKDLPGLVAAWLHRAASEGGAPAVSVQMPELRGFEERIERGSNRLAVALVTLGLYVAASILMQHSVGPRLFGVPVLAAVGYALALWFSFRLARAIGRSGGL